MPRTVRERLSCLARPRGPKLKHSGKPYWRAIDTGLHLGYRKGLNGGRWVCRRYLGAGQYEVATVAIADDHSPADGASILDFFQAQRKARDVAALAKAPPAKTVFTVAAAMDAYFERLEHEGSKSPADAKRRTWSLHPPDAWRTPVADRYARQACPNGLRAWPGRALTAIPAKTPSVPTGLPQTVS